MSHLIPILKVHYFYEVPDSYISTVYESEIENIGDMTSMGYIGPYVDYADARLFGVRWAIDQGYIGRDYADDALRAAEQANAKTM